MVQYTIEQKYQGLLDLMAPMEESNPRFMGLFYGDLGVGKTVLAGMIAEALGGKWLYIDTAEEFTTLKINPGWEHLTRFMTRMTYQGLSQFETLAKATANGISGFDFNGIILDKSSQISDRDLIRITKEKQGLKSLVENDPDLPEWPHRNIAAVRFRDALNNLNSTGCHIIHIAGVREDKDKTNIDRFGPSYPRSIYNAISDPLQIVARVVADIQPMDRDQEKYVRWIQVLPTVNTVAKCRIDGVGFRVSFEELVESIKAFARGERKLVSQSDEIPVY